MTQHRISFIRGIYNLPATTQGSVVTIGCFDGLHLGHQKIMRHVINSARQHNCESVAVTFDPHPQEFFSAQQAPARLMRIRDKLEALEEAGIDRVVCLQFNRRLQSLTAQQFIDQVLLRGLNTRHLVIGDDFRFGSDRKGDFSLLQQAGKETGFSVENTPTVEFSGQRVSSTRIRQVLEAGDFSLARQLLGRPFSINGRVVYGKQVGRELGFPTANINLQRYSAPLAGVYAVRVEIDGRVYAGSANVGLRPTLGDLVEPILEVHLLDYSGNLYGRRLQVEFVEKIRSEKKFATLDELIDNIQRDIDITRAWFRDHEIELK